MEEKKSVTLGELKGKIIIEMQEVIIEQLDKCKKKKKIPSKKLLDTINTFLNVYNCY